MGVPAFFRWLSRKYPSIVVHCDNGVKGTYHFDNLYLDMNGIIHPCSHPENKPPPANEEEMFLAIFEYVENIMKIVKPKKLLYMAIDGVAPRAKMNQQRSRRFRASQESFEKIAQINKQKDFLREQGIEIEEKNDEHFDSNVITPGTEFMINLSEALRSWINKRLSDDYKDVHDIWPKDLVVILSDSSVPGEGEHKIMDYIRRQKACENYDANLSHCLYGADADLIMLGLATHEPNFTILREEFKPNQPRPCDLCGQLGHELKDCTGEPKAKEDLPVVADTEFIYIRINVLREYLEKESHNETSCRLDFERFIDDYVFLCFFVGNDFLPHLPSLEIRENAIDRLIKLYKYVIEAYPNSQDIYLTKNGFVNKDRVQILMKELGEYEDEIFKQRQINEQQYKERNKRQKLMQTEKDLRWMKPEAVSKNEKPEVFHNAKEEAFKLRMAFKDNADSKAKLDKMLINQNEKKEGNNNPLKRKREDEPDSDSEPEDLVQLHNEGWKKRYYYHKFGSESVDKISKQVADEYFKGLCWVLQYYYQGCPDWKWFFPFHYACFASDFHDIEKIDVQFNSTAKPFKPLEQLMSVFPAASSQNLPPTWRDLLINIKSPIIDFYPSSFRIDLNGKKAAWMGVALLPFIDEDRLFKALKSVYQNLSESEQFRNRHGSHLIFTSKKNSILSENIKKITQNEHDEQKSELKNGFINGTLKRSDLYSGSYKHTLCCEFYDPQYSNGFIFPAIMLKNARIPDPVLRPQDVEKFHRYRPIIGMQARNDRAYLDKSGHRTIERSMHKEYEHRNQPFHNQYGYQNYQHQRYIPNDNGNNYYNNNNNRHYNRGNYQGSAGTSQQYFPHHYQQNRYEPYHNNNANNNNNIKSNYSNYSYYQQSTSRGSSYNVQNYHEGYTDQQHYHSQRRPGSNISTYYTPGYLQQDASRRSNNNNNNNNYKSYR